MPSVTIEFSEEKYQRLKVLAESQNVSMEIFVGDVVDTFLAGLDAEARFLARASRGKGREALGLELLKKAAGNIWQENQ